MMQNLVEGNDAMLDNEGAQFGPVEKAMLFVSEEEHLQFAHKEKIVLLCSHDKSCSLDLRRRACTLYLSRYG